MAFTDDRLLLEARGISKGFDGFQALSAVDLQIFPQSITGLIGPNGAGKTTLFNILSGFLTADQGKIWFRGQPLHPLPAHRRVQQGLVRTFQITRVLGRLTVLDNLLLASPQAVGERLRAVIGQQKLIRHQQRHLKERAMEILGAIGLADHAHSLAGSLSGGQRKLLELGRVVMTQPQLILLDEPAAGVNPTLMDQLCEHIVFWHHQGISFLIIEHNMDVVMSLCQDIWVLAEGKNLVQGSAAMIQSHPQVREAYLGQ